MKIFVQLGYFDYELDVIFDSNLGVIWLGFSIVGGNSKEIIWRGSCNNIDNSGVNCLDAVVVCGNYFSDQNGVVDTSNWIGTVWFFSKLETYKI